MEKTLILAVLILSAGTGWALDAARPGTAVDPAVEAVFVPNELEVTKERAIGEIVQETFEASRAPARLPKKLGGDPRTEALIAFIESHQGSADGRLKLINAVWALGEIGGEEAEAALSEALPDADRTTRLNIVAALDKIGAVAVAGQDSRRADPDGLYGHLEPGDVLFRKGYFGLLNSLIKAQTVGHVGIYVGIENGEPMVIDAWQPLRKISLRGFISNWPFYGNYTTLPEPTSAQRETIIGFVNSQLGKPFDAIHLDQKGPVKFDCVGLAEAAYESAGLNPTPDAFESGWGWPLTPTEQYEHMFPNF